MEPFGWIAVAAGLAVAYFVTVARRNRFHETMREVSKRLGLTLVEQDRGSARGRYRGFDVDLRVDKKTADDHTTYRLHHRLYAPDKIPTDVLLGSSDGLPRQSTAKVLATMDADFDRHFTVSGQRAEALAMLGASTRRALTARLHDVSLIVAAGALVAVRDDADHDDADTIVRRLDELVELAERLAVPHEEIFDRLMLNALGDPLAAVRAENLNCASAVRPGSDALLALCRRALRDTDPRVRRVAATNLEDEGRDELRALAVSSEVPEDVAADALKSYATGANGAELAELLQAILRSSPHAAAKKEALDIVRAHRAAVPATEIVAALDASSLVPAETVLRALVTIGDGSVTSAIVSRLAAFSPADKVAACRALRVIGTVEAVEALRELTRGVLRDREVAAAADQAIAAIQLRARGEAGRLSVIDGAEAGGLALAEGGALAVADGQDDP